MNKENCEDEGVKIPRGQINYNTVGASAGIASFLGLNANTAMSALKKNGGNGGNGGNGSTIIMADNFGPRLHACDEVVTQKEFCYAQQNNEKDSEIARLKSEKYTDGGILAAYKETVQGFRAADEKTNAVVKDVTSALIELRQSTAVLETKVSCMEKENEGRFKCLDQKLDYEINGVYRDIKSNTALLRKDIDCCCDSTKAAIALEGERRNAGLKELQCWVAATYVPGKLVMPLDSICPEAMKRYNAWEAPTNSPANQQS